MPGLCSAVPAACSGQALISPSSGSSDYRAVISQPICTGEARPQLLADHGWRLQLFPSGVSPQALVFPDTTAPFCQWEGPRRDTMSMSMTTELWSFTAQTRKCCTLASVSRD